MKFLFIFLSFVNYCYSVDSDKEDIVFDQKSEVFNQFLLNFDQKSRLFNNKNHLYYIKDDVFYCFNLKKNKFKTIKLNVNLTIVFACFFDGINLFLVTCNELFVFDLNGNIVASTKFLKNYKIYPKHINIHNGIIYIIGFNNRIFAFDSDYSDNSKINLIWVNNDCYTVTSAFKCEYCFKDDFLYLLIKDRVCIIDCLNGKIKKNVYLKYHYDHLIYSNEKLVLSTNMRFAYIDLKDFSFKEVNDLEIGKNIYNVNFEDIVFNDKKYDLNYVKRICGNEFYFAYRIEKNDTKYLFINKKKFENKGVLKNFKISYVFFYGNRLLLIDGDGKDKKFRIF